MRSRSSDLCITERVIFGALITTANALLALYERTHGDARTKENMP